MKIKKIFVGLLVLASVLLLAACGNTTDNHTHSFEAEWSQNANFHWHDAACEHTDEVSDKATHTWDSGVVTTEPTEEVEGVKVYSCTVCEYRKEVKIEKLPHTHKYSTEWSYDEEYHWYAPTCEDTDELLEFAEHIWDEGVVTTNPGCVDAGVKTYTCACGATKTEPVDAVGHSYADVLSHDETHHWYASTCGHADAVKDKAEHAWDEGTVIKTPTCTEAGEKTFTCACGATKVEEVAVNENDHIDNPETVVSYANGYAITSYKVCGVEVSREAHLTVDHTYNPGDGSATTDKLGAKLNEDGTYSFEIETPKWGRFVMYLEGVAISSTDCTITGKAWNGGGYAGTYPLYHEGDTITFLTATGGVYPVIYNPETKELQLGKIYEAAPEHGFNVQMLNLDSELTVWTKAGTVIRATDGTYPALPGQWTPWRLYIAVDAQGRLAYLCLYIPNGYGGATGDTYIRHSAYTDYTLNPALVVDETGWGIVVPEGGYVITAHSGTATVLVQTILNDASIEATDPFQGQINSNSHNVDDIRIVFNTEKEWVLIHKYDEGEVTTEPTCTEPGVKTYTCACGDTYTEEVPALGHSHSSEWSKDENQHWHECSCGDKKDLANHTLVYSGLNATAKKAEYTCACGHVEQQSKVTIYLTLNWQWNIRIYTFGPSTNGTHNEMKFAGHNGNGEAVYSYEIDLSKIDTIIFCDVDVEGNNYWKQQTIDIKLYDVLKTDNAFYFEWKDNKNQVGTWNCDPTALTK